MFNWLCKISRYWPVIEHGRRYLQTDNKARTTAGKPFLEHIEIIVDKAELISPLNNNKPTSHPPNKDSLCSSVESSELNSNLCALLTSINILSFKDLFAYFILIFIIFLFLIFSHVYYIIVNTSHFLSIILTYPLQHGFFPIPVLVLL